MVISVLLGSVNLPIQVVMQSLISNTPYSYIIRNIRVPRVIGSVMAGAILALSGVVFQTSFKNELADPYLLGVSSGATLAIAISTLFGIILHSSISLPVIGFIGSTFSSFICISVAKQRPQSIIISGVALSSLFSSLTSLLIYLNRDSLSSIFFWTMGSFSSVSIGKASVLSGILLIELLLLIKNSNAMNLLLLDDTSARSLGINPVSLRISLILLANLSTSIVVSYCGVIGFVGIIAPHIARKIVGNSHNKLIPFSTILGALIMIVSDDISRTILLPSEIPVGIITSIIGSPVFIMLAFKENKKNELHSYDR